MVHGQRHERYRSSRSFTTAAATTAHQRRPLPWSLVAVAVVATSCAPQYAYVPTTNATATMQGKRAAEYAIPSGAPEGDVRIASYGMTDVTPASAPDSIVRALHLRVVLQDDGATPWTFDTRQQRVTLEGGDAIPPAFASANLGTPPPLVIVGGGQRRVVDLFFLLPPHLRHADAVPEFDALWRVDTASGSVAERTPFERLAVEPDYGAYDDWDYGTDYYWGPPYWVDPSLGYTDAYLVGGVFVRRSPHFWHGGGGLPGTGRGGFHGGGPPPGGGRGGHR